VKNLFNGIYNNRRVLLTGHTGFKGSWLLLWLQQLGANVMGYALPPDTEIAHIKLLGLFNEHSTGNIIHLQEIKKVFETFQPDNG
jgi:CDP-glucose 4,6-dehydratase